MSRQGFAFLRPYLYGAGARPICARRAHVYQNFARRCCRSVSSDNASPSSGVEEEEAYRTKSVDRQRRVKELAQWQGLDQLYPSKTISTAAPGEIFELGRASVHKNQSPVHDDETSTPDTLRVACLGM